MNILRDILKKQGEGKVAGIPSYCTANPQVLKAILINARDKNIPVLIEANTYRSDSKPGKPVWRLYRNEAGRLQKLSVSAG